MAEELTHLVENFQFQKLLLPTCSSLSLDLRKLSDIPNFLNTLSTYDKNSIIFTLNFLMQFSLSFKLFSLSLRQRDEFSSVFNRIYEIFSILNHFLNIFWFSPNFLCHKFSFFHYIVQIFRHCRKKEKDIFERQQSARERTVLRAKPKKISFCLHIFRTWTELPHFLLHLYPEFYYSTALNFVSSLFMSSF